ncbi:MAG: FecR family protein [Sideroxydans sp.]|nr:FecR family protein [Sideroxydans sp.]
MNKLISNSVWLGIIAILYSSISHAETTAGTIKSIKGEVSIVRNEVSINAFNGMPLLAADKIVTGPNSSVGITLKDSTLLSFGAKSVSQLSEYRYDPVKRDGNLLISVFKGSMRFVTGLLGKQNPSAIAIKLPTATIGVRGTDFVVTAQGQE